MELDLGIADFHIQRSTSLDRSSLDDGRQDRIERFAEILNYDRMAALKSSLELAHHIFLTQSYNLTIARRVAFLVS